MILKVITQSHHEKSKLCKLVNDISKLNTKQTKTLKHLSLQQLTICI